MTLEDLKTREKVGTFEIALKNLPIFLSVLSITAIIYGFLFNFGYFYRLGFEYLTLLSFKDYLDSTLPFLTIGPLGFLIITFIQLTNKKTFKEFFTPYKQAISKSFFKNIIFFILISPFFIIQLIGTYLLYFFLITHAWIFCQKIEGTQNADILHIDQPYVYLTLIIIIAFDLFIKSRPKKYEIRKDILRFILISGCFTFFSGMNVLVDQLASRNSWNLILENNTVSNVSMMRSIEKGIIYFQPTKKEISFIVWDQIKEINRKPKI